jgi:peptidoglycan L-alanyl-D-glutamate endopeptidase CwlK
MYQLGKTSIQRLQGVDPRLVRCVQRAIQLTAQDFTVLEGVRTLATQREYVNRGASQTMNSRHLKQPDGLGKAVDLVPWVAGTPRWEWPLIWPIAEAMRLASIELGVPIRWGGSWSRLDQLGSAGAIKRASEAYVAARKAAKKSAFLDGPHYEIPAGF